MLYANFNNCYNLNWRNFHHVYQFIRFNINSDLANEPFCLLLFETKSKKLAPSWMRSYSLSILYMMFRLKSGKILLSTILTICEKREPRIQKKVWTCTWRIWRELFKRILILHWHLLKILGFTRHEPQLERGSFYTRTQTRTNERLS